MHRKHDRDDKIRILAMDGGTHGFTWLFCLREIEEDNPGFLAQADVFTGSSFGGFCSLYFARHMGDLRPGESALPIIQGCFEFMRELLTFEPDEAAFARLRAGNEAMYSFDRMEKVLTDPKHLGNARLGDLHRRVIISACGTTNPAWATRVYDSADKEDQDALASEVGLESAALPLLLPVRNGLANGSVGGTNGSLHGLTHVVGGNPRVPLDKIVLFSLGGDPETSSLSKFGSPWTGISSVPKKLSFETMLQPSPAHAQALAMLGQKVESLWKELEDNSTSHTDPAQASSRQGFALTPPKEAKPVEPGQRSTSWGWRQWFAHEPSPLFLYQVVLNNQSLNTTKQVKLLLGERAFRLAPMALLNYGQILFMTFLADARASETIIKVADLTAELWGDPETSRAFEFTPNVDETEAFVDTYWMPRPEIRRRNEERLSGWRRARQTV